MCHGATSAVPSMRRMRGKGIGLEESLTEGNKQSKATAMVEVEDGEKWSTIGKRD